MGNQTSISSFVVLTETKTKSLKKRKKQIQNKTEPILIIDQKGKILAYNTQLLFLLKHEENEVELLNEPIFTIFKEEENSEQKKTQKKLFNEKLFLAMNQGTADFDWDLQTPLGVVLKCHLWLVVQRTSKKDLVIQIIARNHMNKEKMKKVQLGLSSRTQLTPRDLADFCLNEAIRISNSKVGFIAFITKDQKKGYVFSWSEEVMATCNMVQKPIDFDINKSAIWGKPVRTKKVIIINNYQDTSVKKNGYPKGHIKMLRVMGIPIFYNNEKKKKVVLIVYVANKESPYSTTDSTHLSTLMDRMWNLFQTSSLINY
ncbi:hypothetical protein M0813_16482 [Anaeramoeba flamelloides]|uniref:PAS domain-containing protein n=1 Tax=Anaeramoeba flamelloides TaxID=1746091 RepID=A0ABQ8YYW8_9EUKA|nr:hypothetical protein M0813_16482 [Anaeramoeba flamelloides]